jgi:uncharacterized protein
LNTRRDIVICLLIGAAAGLMSGLMGVGGGIVMIPLMTTFLGLSQHKAHGTSLAVIVFTAISGALAYFLWQASGAQKDISQAEYLLIAIELALGSMVGARVGASIMNRIPARELRMLFGIFNFFVAWRLLLPMPKSAFAFAPASMTGFIVILLLGLTAGFLSGIMGVGGGIIMVPAMVLLIGLPQPFAQGISLLVIIPTSLVGASTHLHKGNVVTRIVPWIAVVSIFTAVLGSSLAIGPLKGVLTQLFGVFLLIVSLQMTITAWRQSPQKVAPQNTAPRT